MSINKIRSGQLLSPFGIGQIVNFPEELSLMICGLNLWEENIQQRRIEGGIIDEGLLRFNENRLQNLLDVEYFIKPFPYKNSGINTKLNIPAVRFPQWHHCTKITCGRMVEVGLTFATKHKKCPSCDSKMIPVRFVAVCSHGHIQDVPFKEWVHNGPVPSNHNEHILSYKTLSGSGNLGSILIKCSCGQKRTLSGLMNIHKNGDEIYDSALARIGLSKDNSQKYSEQNKNDNNPTGEYCKGYRPWLGPKGVSQPVNCNRHLQVLIRGGSNIHYSEIISALHLPEVSADINEYVTAVIKRETKEHLSTLLNQDGNGSILKIVLSNKEEVRKGLISIDELQKGVIQQLTINDKESEEVTDLKSLRIQEYNFILNGSTNKDFRPIVVSLDQYIEKDLLNTYFDNIVLIEKLKETRVFRGFSRINPANRLETSELSMNTINWLPAYEVFGEGIFLKFKDDKIDSWNKDFSDNFSAIIKRYHSAMLQRRPKEDPKNLNPTFVMMHTFAHLLIKRLCFNCGYGSSSLRERIYFSDDKENRMNGILIYTSSGDSEGSLGGLVRQGREMYLGKLVRDSIEDARWCSSDPVCSDIGQSSGQGPDNVNGSACHNCCLVPETSCEEYNSLLDRSSVVGTLENPEIGYFY